MPGPSAEDKARQIDTASGSGKSRRERGSRNSYPQPTAPKPGAVNENNINDAGGPVQSTDPNAPAPRKGHKDIPLESGPADGDKENAIGRLDTDHDSDAAARTRATQFNPTRPWDDLRRPGREL